MKNFVVYHIKNRMGYPVIDVDDLGIYTKKEEDFVKKSINGKVWLIGGEGSPRRYYLRACFDLRSYNISDREDFKYKVTGKNGHLLHPMPEVGYKKWFTTFQKKQGNFAFGFNEIKQREAIDGLQVILSDYLK